jgi:peptidoglycan/LPS O-acetylase OafA/YrhL
LTDRTLFRLMIAMFVAAFAWKVADALIWDDFIRTYYRFDTRLGGLLLGGALAVRPVHVSSKAAQVLGRYALVVLLALVIALNWNGMPSLLAGGFMTELAAVALLISLTSEHETAAKKALSQPLLVYLGVLSYSIYLWHYGIAIVLRDMLDPLLSFSLTLGASVALASLSHRYMEAPLRRWVNRGKPRNPVQDLAHQPG